MHTRFRKIAKPSDRDLRLRVPGEVLGALEKKARENGRSRNAEILVRLVKTIEGEGIK